VPAGCDIGLRRRIGGGLCYGKVKSGQVLDAWAAAGECPCQRREGLLARGGKVQLVYSDPGRSSRP
jgi:hypothetical protein